MFVQSFEELAECVAGDGTRLREYLHPAKHAVKLGYSLAHASLPPQTWSALHVLTSSEVYFILRGTGRMEIDSESRDVAPGDMIYIPPQARQRILCTSKEPLEFLCIVDPAWRAEDETVLEDVRR